MNLSDNNIRLIFNLSNNFPKSLEGLLLTLNKLEYVDFREILDQLPKLKDMNLAYCGDFEIVLPKSSEKFKDRGFKIGIELCRMTCNLKPAKVIPGCELYYGQHPKVFMRHRTYVHHLDSMFNVPGIYVPVDDVE